MKNITNNKHNRDIFLDFVKGVLIYLVLWGHSIQFLSAGYYDFYEDIVFKTIYSFHMPLFMFISGFFFYFSCQKKSITQLLLSKVNGICVPLLLWGGGSSIGLLVLRLSSNLKDSIEKGFFGLWFLWAVLLSSIIVGVIYKIFPKSICYILMFLCGLGLLLFPFHSDLILFVYPFFVLGFIYNEQKVLNSEFYQKIEKYMIPTWIILLFFFKKKHYIYISGISLINSKYGIIDQSIINIYRFFVCYLGLNSFLVIARLFYKSFRKKIFINSIAYIGRFTMPIYILQTIFLTNLTKQVVLRIVNKLGRNPFTSNILFFDIILTPIVALFWLSIFIILINLIRKNRTLSKLLLGTSS